MSRVEICARPKSRTGRAAEWAVDVLMGLLGGRPETSHGNARHLPVEKLATVGDGMLDGIGLSRANLDALIQDTPASRRTLGTRQRQPSQRQTGGLLAIAAGSKSFVSMLDKLVKRSPALAAGLGRSPQPRLQQAMTTPKQEFSA
jgi:hypothetical protein